jgi:hypothetical protein
MSKPQLLEEENIQVDFSTELSSHFLINCIDRVIKLKNPLFKKVSFESENKFLLILVEPKDLLIEVNSTGVKELNSKNGEITIIIPIDVIIVKQFQNFLTTFERRIEFSIEFQHSFRIELLEDCKIQIKSVNTNFSWIKVPNLTILLMDFNISNYIEPKLKEHLDKTIVETYLVLSQALEEQIKEMLKTISKSFEEPKTINKQQFYLYIINIMFEKNLICVEEEGMKIYGSIQIGFSKVQQKSIFSLKVGKIEKPKNIQAMNLISLGNEDLNNPFTLKMFLKIPIKNLLRKVFSVGSVIVNTKEGLKMKSNMKGLVTMKATMNGEVQFLKRKITSNDISFDVNIPIHLHVIKLGVERKCLINVKFSFSIMISEMGIELKNCKGLRKFYFIL